MSGPSPRDIVSFLGSQLFVKVPIPTSSFAGQTVIVTGSSTGLGKEAAKHLVRLNAAKVILAVRTISKGEEARAYIEKQTGHRNVVEVWPLDKSSFASVKAFAKRAENLERLDAVIENAGMWPNKFETMENNEATITVNVTSAFLIYHLLRPTLQRTAASFSTITRFTIVDSMLHKFASLKARHSSSIFSELAKPLDAKDYNMRYNDSKLLVLLYGRELAAAQPLGQSDKPNQTHTNSGIVLNFVAPGWCVSELRRGESAFGEKLMSSALQRTADQGACTLVDAVKPVSYEEAEARHGAYIDDLKVKRPLKWLDSKEGKETAKRVWQELNGILEGVQSGITEEMA